MGLFKEIGNWMRFNRMPLEKRRILFYAEHAGYANNFQPTMDVLVKQYGAHICYATSDPADPMLARQDPAYTVFHVQALMPLLIGGLGDGTVCVMTMPALEVYHVKRSKKRVNYVYLFHSLMSASMTYQYRAFDHYDTVCCTGPYQVAELRKTEALHGTPVKKLVEAGYTRLDDVAREYEAFCKNPPPKEAPHVLVAPSWGESSMLDACRDETAEMLEGLLAEGYAVTLRYHPETLRRRKDLVDFYEARFGGRERMRIEKSVATNQSMLEADVLVTEWSSISLEYAFGTERPVVYVDTPQKVQNEKYAEIGIEPFEVKIRREIGRTVPPQEMAGIRGIVKEMIENGASWRERIVALREENIFHFRHAAEKNAAAIMEAVEAVRG